MTVRKITKVLLQTHNLIEPGIFLHDIQGKMMLIRKFAKDLILAGSQEG